MKIKHFIFCVVTICALSLTVLVARANDGGIAWGGSPKLLSSHPSVAMRSEVITMNVGKENVTVDCRFVFKNYGRATTVRMGFPDEGSGDMDVDQEADTSNSNWKTTKPRSMFTSFKSWVNGVPTKTEFVRSDTFSQNWHAKTVYFPSSSTRLVRDLYTVPIGGQVARYGYYNQAFYTLHTGASWRGAIGRSEIVVNFPNLKDAILKPVRLQKLDDSGVKVLESKLRADKGKATVVYVAPVAPTAKGRTLRFVRTNWNPTKRDDILLFFGYQKAMPQ